MAEVMTIQTAFAIIGGGNGKQEWWDVKLKQRLVVYPKDGERKIGEIGETYTVSKSHAIELIGLERATLIEKQEPKKKEKQNG